MEAAKILYRVPHRQILRCPSKLEFPISITPTDQHHLWKNSTNPRSGTLITFAQYLVVTIEGLVSNLEFPKKKSRLKRSKSKDFLASTELSSSASSIASVPSDSRNTIHQPHISKKSHHRPKPFFTFPRLRPTVIPLNRWMVMVVLFFASSVLNNIALGFNISMPFHIIFRSGSLIISMFLGYIILGKRYNANEILGVVLVTIGVVLNTNY